MQRCAFEAAGAQSVDGGADAMMIRVNEESVMAMGEMPGVCVALQQDNRRERDGEAQVLLSLPDGNNMLGRDGCYQVDATNEHDVMAIGELPGACVAQQ